MPKKRAHGVAFRPGWVKRRDRRFGRRLREIRQRAHLAEEWEAEGRATLELEQRHDDEAA